MAEADPPAHPLALISAEKCHELLMAERNLLVTAKADRENELTRTVIQLSSAALLAIPAIVASKEFAVPRFSNAPMFYAGLISIGTSLLLAITEQHLSSIAYNKQIKIVFDYYTLNSDLDHDVNSLRMVRSARFFALIAFGFGMISSSIGLANLL